MSGRTRVVLRRLVQLVAFGVIVVLPIGALGAIDWSYTSSVGVPLPRTKGQQQHWEPSSRAITSVTGETVVEPVGRLLAPVSSSAPTPLVGLALVALLVVAVVVRVGWRPPPGALARALPVRGPPFAR